MALSSGARLGPYEIQSGIGAGGMGEVYKARDTRLDRIVAIKVLPPALASDPHFRERFDREARTISSLDHPHICALYDVGQHGDTAYLVMQYLEGETLAERLEKGAMPLADALRIAGEIADALDKAHRQGIVHRDLKPGNVMLTKAGSKLLDFGLAKTATAMSAGTILETVTSPLTARGTVLGTWLYMSPEQLEGRDADTRADIWAFGCVLYEMITGRKTFERRSQASIIGAILKDEPPPLSTLQPLAPVALDRLILACLEKDPDDRWQSIRDVRRELAWLGGPTAGVKSVTGPITTGHYHPRLVWGLAALLAVAIAALAVIAVKRPAPAQTPLTRLSITLTPATSYDLIRGTGRSLAISPDGLRIVYASNSAPGRRRLLMRSLDRLTIEPLAGTEGAFQPFFSPDGRWLAFSTIAGELKKLPLDGGGPPVTLVRNLLNGQWVFGTWRDDNIIVFSAFENLLQVPADGGTPQPLTTVEPAQKESFHHFPLIVPGTGDVLFTVVSDDGTWRLELLRWDTRTREKILDDAGGAVLTRSGHLLFVRDDLLMAAQFDAPARRVVGSPIPLPDAVVTDNFANPQLVVSASGTLAFVAANPDSPEPTAGWMSRSGEFSAIGSLPKGSRIAWLSPDDSAALVDAGHRIYLFDIARRIATPLNLGQRRTETVAWHPDGKRISLGGPYLSLLDLDRGVETRLTEDGRPKRNASWSPDGKVVTYMTYAPNNDLYMVTLEPNARPRPFLATGAVEDFPSIAPDGRWVAYRSSPGGAGQMDVFVARFPDGTGRVQVTSGGAGPPMWNRNGRELLFSAPPGVMQLVPVTLGEQFQFGTARTLFPLTGLNLSGLSSDGSRFFAIRAPDVKPPMEIVVVQNWFGELRSKVGGQK